MPGKPPLSPLLPDVAVGDSLSAAEENLLRHLATRTVDLPDAIVDSRGIRMAQAGAGATESTPVDPGLYWCILMEDHPGHATCFKINVGTWCPSEYKYRFACSTETYEWGIDFHYGVPYPTQYAKGWFKRELSDWTTSGYIYVAVSMDCESDGVCESGACQEAESDPCEGGS